MSLRTLGLLLVPLCLGVALIVRADWQGSMRTLDELARLRRAGL